MVINRVQKEHQRFNQICRGSLVSLLSHESFRLSALFGTRPHAKEIDAHICVDLPTASILRNIKILPMSISLARLALTVY